MSLPKVTKAKKIKKVKNKIGARATSKNFDQIVQKWQTLGTPDLSNLFCAYNDQSQSAERVVRYELDSQVLQQLVSPNNLRVRIYMGTDPQYTPGPIGDEPPFIPLIQGYKAFTSPGWNNTYQMTWAPHSSPTEFTLPLSKTRPLAEISSQTSDLFVADWSAQSFTSLGSLFEAPAPLIVCRVKHYEFGQHDSQRLKTLITQHNNLTLYMLMGSANSHDQVSDPYNFRPILHLVQDADSSPVSLLFLEFSNPCPPAC